ncbi:LuxR C-terminal-related transcriptional regulator [Ruminococcaceae bacterium OttesenSCG-928-O06]|nr:LuxR C-terminal-related transcriptional regulator [Ruminococcaceae bacterium OttesenSCG-928-O06]
MAPNPSAESRLILRPRLNAVLNAALQEPFVVLSAGAGFGKTTGMAQCLAGSAARAVWFSFAEPDNIPARFWEHLAQAFAQHRPALGQKMQALGFPETLQAFSAFLADLTGELYEDEKTVVFVFDDVHLIHEGAVLAFLGHLVAARLENSCIALLCRTWPLPGAAFLLAPHTIEAGALRFSVQETKAYLKNAGLAVSTADAEKIWHYVSGWPVALSLVALALQRGEQALPAFDAAALAAAKPALYELIQREIFSQYTAAEQQLLVQLSALDSFPRGLVQAVSGERERDLGALLNGNIFIRYDADAMRLAFHPIYQAFLREKLLAVPQPVRDETYQKAGDWCRENGHYFDAAGYYRQCRQYGLLWDTLLQIDATRHKKSEAEFFIAQIEALPQEFRTQHPMTYIVLGVMLVNNLRFAEAAEALDAAEALLGQAGNAAPDDTRQLRGELAVARGFLTLGLEQNGFEKHFQEAARRLPAGSRRWGGKLQLIDLGPGLNLQSAKPGELQKSLACFTQGVPYMAKVLHGTGQGLDKLCECEALFLTGEVKNAAAPGYQALYSAQAAAQYDIVGNALFMLLRIYTAQGDYARLLDTLEHVQRYEADAEAQALGIWDIIRGWFYAEVGQVEKTAGWIRNPVQKGFAPISIGRALLVRLRGLVAAGQYAEAAALLGQMQALAEGQGAVITRLYVHLGWAVVHHHLGDAAGSATALKAAYALARGNNIVMPFIEYGSQTRTLLQHAQKAGGHGMPAAWLADIHARASTYAKHHAYLVGRYRQQQEDQRTDYALSPREAELLALLSQGLTREEVAAAMQLSINTVKSLTKQAFAKLGAINAADAVRIAIINQLI